MARRPELDTRGVRRVYRFDRPAVVAAWLVIGLVHVTVASAAPPVEVAARAADMVTLVGGEQLFGSFAAPPTGDEATFYVARDWLRKHQPAYYRQLAAGEAKRRKEALQQYAERLAAWRERRAEPKILNDFLARSQRDVESRLRAIDKGGEPEPSQLLVVALSAKRVKRFVVQPPASQRLLALAWESHIAGGEDLSVAALTEQLKQHGVDVEHGQPDLSDRFDVVPLDARQWAAKVSQIEFKILGTPRFQGTGSTLVEDGADGGRPPLADLLGGLVQDQLGGALEDLLNPQPAGNRGTAPKQQAAVDRALASAAERHVTGVRITYLDQDFARLRATVTDTFYAWMPDHIWQSIWQQSSTVSVEPGQDLGEKELAADPQIAEVLKTLKGLGLDGNQDLVKSALRFGGATQKAMRATDAQFGDYLLSQTRRLIGPPVQVPKPQSAP